MRKSRGEKVFEAGTRQGRVRTIRRGGTRAEKFFRRRRYTRMGTRFLKRVSATSFERLASTPSSPCHATLSVVGRDALFQRWSIEDRATKTVFSSKRMFLFFFIHQFSDLRIFTNLFIFLTTRDTVSRFPQFSYRPEHINKIGDHLHHVVKVFIDPSLNSLIFSSLIHSRIWIWLNSLLFIL